MTWNSRTPASSQGSEDLTLGLNEPDGAPSPSRRSTPTPAPSSQSDGPESRTSVTSFARRWRSESARKPTGWCDGHRTVTGKQRGGDGWHLQPSGQAASPAKTSASPASGQDSPGSAAASPTPSSTLWSDTDLRHPPRKRSGPPLHSSRQRPWGAPRSPGELGYWWAYRILDAQHFGVPQRRRRVFIVALHAERGFGADSAAAVLSVGTRCGRHPATGHAKGEDATDSTERSADVVGHNRHRPRPPRSGMA